MEGPSSNGRTVFVLRASCSLHAPSGPRSSSSRRWCDSLDVASSRAASFILPGHCIQLYSTTAVPGTDKELDYVSLAKSADVVKAFPKLGWVDSSAITADTVAAPLLSIAGVVCLPVFLEDPTTPASRTFVRT